MKEFSIDRNTEGQRIDRYLSDELEDRSRSYIQKIMKEGYVKVYANEEEFEKKLKPIKELLLDKKKFIRKVKIILNNRR